VIRERTQYCTFRSGGRLFGVSILDVREVTTETACTRIPHAPDEVAGYVNIRGHIHLALDLRRMLGLPGETDAVARHLVLFKSEVGPAFGVLVDEIGDIVTVDASQIEPLDSSQGGPADDDRDALVVEICKLPDELLAVLEPRRFLPFVEKAGAAV
jgi:purine-binding chemotaxis protein CheW